MDPKPNKKIDPDKIYAPFLKLHDPNRDYENLTSTPVFQFESALGQFEEFEFLWKSEKKLINLKKIEDCGSFSLEQLQVNFPRAEGELVDLPSLFNSIIEEINRRIDQAKQLEKKNGKINWAEQFTDEEIDKIKKNFELIKTKIHNSNKQITK